jgi:hypothetical protein
MHEVQIYELLIYGISITFQPTVRRLTCLHADEKAFVFLLFVPQTRRHSLRSYKFFVVPLVVS